MTDYLSLDEVRHVFKIFLPSLLGLGLDPLWAEARRAGATVGKLTPIANWEDLSDLDLLHIILDGDTLTGDVILVPNWCFWGKNRSAFRVDASNLENFIVEFLSECGEAFFNGDALIFSVRSSQLYCFQHDGLCSKVELG